MTTTPIPQTPPDYDLTRVIERPDGFYWQDKLTETGRFTVILFKQIGFYSIVSKC